MSKRFLLIVCTLISSIGFLACEGAAQSEQGRDLTERIHKNSGSITVVFNDLNQVRADIGRLMDDVGFGAMKGMLDQVLPLPEASGLDLSAGAVVYAGDRFMDAIVIEFVVADREKLKQTLGLSADFEFPESEWHSIEDGDAPLMRLFNNLLGDTAYRFLCTGERVRFAPADWTDGATALFEQPLLSETASPRARQIINQSGITLIGFNDLNLAEETFDLDPIIANYQERLTEQEIKWLKQFAEVLVTSEFGLVGLKYQESKMLEIRSVAQFSEGRSLDSVMDIENRERDWQPALGLEQAQLVLAGAIQMDAFHSSAGPRVVPQLLLGEFGNNEGLRFLQGNMLNILLELGGDSWNELNAARLALYANEDQTAYGQMALIGVLDAQDPAEVMTELGFLSSITNPMMAAERTDQKEEEIQRLIMLLKDDDPNESARAETRLGLAGPAAIPFLKEAYESADERSRTRIDRVLRELERRQERIQGRSAVADPWFWTTLNPGLELFESKGKVGKFDLHTIEITPDPSKTEQEVEDAIQVMAGLFGPQWNEVRVVQVEDRFVFLLGSDNELLERTVQNVAANESKIAATFKDAGKGSRQGQLQMFLDTNQLTKMLDMYQFAADRPASERICWVGLDFNANTVAADALIPVEQVIQFLIGGFGG